MVEVVAHLNHHRKHFPEDLILLEALIHRLAQGVDAVKDGEVICIKSYFDLQALETEHVIWNLTYAENKCSNSVFDLSYLSSFLDKLIKDWLLVCSRRYFEKLCDYFWCQDVLGIHRQ